MIGAIFSASIGSARAQDASPASPSAPEAATPGQPQYPPQGYPQYPPYQQYPGAPTMYPPQGPAAWPRYIKDWQEGQPVPYGYHPEARARKGLVIPGAVIFGVAYLLSTLVAAADDDTYDGANRYTALWVPVVGPFIQMGRSTNTGDDMQMFFLDGAAQTAGLTMLVLGLAFPRTILVRNDVGTISLLPTPMRIGRDGSGLGLLARF